MGLLNIGGGTTTGHGVAVTFDSQTAFDNPSIDFINVLHPLTQSIAKYYSETGKIYSNAHHVKLTTERLAPGFYLYFVYRLRVHAAKSANTLETVILRDDLEIACTDEDAEILLGEMVEGGEDSSGVPYDVNPALANNACQKAANIFHERIDKIREEISRNNDAFINRRLESLVTSYGKNLKMQSMMDPEIWTVC